jgi:sRNA-binding protein
MQNRAPFRQSASAPGAGTDTEVRVVVPDRDQEVVQQVAQTLKLEAVVRSDSPWAFVNDRMLRIGDKLTVERGAGHLEFEVLQIYEDAVLVECNGIQLMLKLAQVMEVRK